jgi:hypothetical protein
LYDLGISLSCLEKCIWIAYILVRHTPGNELSIQHVCLSVFIASPLNIAFVIQRFWLLASAR